MLNDALAHSLSPFRTVPRLLMAHVTIPPRVGYAAMLHARGAPRALVKVGIPHVKARTYRHLAVPSLVEAGSIVALRRSA